MRAHVRIVLGSIVGISIAMLLLLGLHVGGEDILTFAPYTVPLGAVIGTALALVAVSIPMRPHKSREPWLKREQVAWALIGCALIAWTIGVGLWTASLATGQPSFPSVADLGFSSFPLLVCVGLILQPFSKPAHRRVFLLVDSLILIGALLSMAWFLLLGPLAQPPTESPLGTFLHLYYPISDIFLLSALVFMLLRGSDQLYRTSARGISLLILALGLMIYATGDLLYHILQHMGLYVEGTWVDLGWPLGIMTIGVAAYLRRFLPCGPARRLMDEPAQGDTGQRHFGSVHLVIFALLCSVSGIAAILSYETSMLQSIVLLCFSVIFLLYGLSAFLARKKAGKRTSPQQSEGAINHCPSCQQPITWQHAHFCSACGISLAPQCSHCHIPLKRGDAFCYQCGESILKNTPPFPSPALPIGSPASLAPTIKAQTSVLVCPSCRAPRTAYDAFCGACGTSLTSIGTDQTLQL